MQITTCKISRQSSNPIWYLILFTSQENIYFLSKLKNVYDFMNPTTVYMQYTNAIKRDFITDLSFSSVIIHETNTNQGHLTFGT